MTPRENSQAEVIRRTCDCEPVFYELCREDRLGFIRRTRRLQGLWLIEETGRWHDREAEAMWIALLYGLVR
ncbi:hypothetical protein [Streptosporangium sp. NPDC087985]|uniref:hypothetical protein n=1 Tax=Streptosporangium sp. NPDC087985 TaxID=3366196 RepID=UPI003824F213